MDQKTFYKSLQEMIDSNRPFVLVTLTDIRLSAPQEIGAKMVVSGDGLEFGTVGGGKMEAAAIREATKMLHGNDHKRVQSLRWNLKKDINMTCGGEVSLLFERFHSHTWNIAIFGAGHVSQALIRILVTIDCSITCCDTRLEWLDKLPDHPRLKRIHTESMEAEVLKFPEDTFFISMTQGHSYDLPILIQLLEHRDPVYVGVIGSASKAWALKRGLKDSGIDPARIDRIFCPIGLKIGSNEPPEIAISIVAQLLEQRNYPVVSSQ